MAKRKQRGSATTDSKRNWREEKSDLYRRISVRMYADSKFQALSPLKPSGQALLIYLFTGPHTNLIPGLFSAGRAGLAEQLGWTQDEFDSCWSEIEEQGLVQAAWRDRVVWVPNAIKHNEPASPSVVVSWRSHWPLIPECNLKWTAYKFIRNYLETEKDKSFVSAFVSACLLPADQTAALAGVLPAVQPAPRTALHQEAGAGTGTGTGAGVVPPLPAASPSIGFPSGIALVSEAWSEVGMTRDLAISGEPYSFVTGRLAEGVPAEHLVAGLHAAKWFHEEGLARSVFGAWKAIVDETPVGGKFHYAKTPWPGLSLPASGKHDIDDAFAGTGVRLHKPERRIGRIR